MESRWRGAKGEVGGEAGDEYGLRCSFSRELRSNRDRIGGITESRSNILKSLMTVEEKQEESVSSQTLLF